MKMQLAGEGKFVMLSPRELEQKSAALAKRLVKQKAWLENRAGLNAPKPQWIIVSRRTRNKSGQGVIPLQLVNAMRNACWLEQDPSGALRLTPAGHKKMLGEQEGQTLVAMRQLRRQLMIKDEEGRTVCVSSNDTESPLGWMRARKDKDGNPMINDAQFEAGERIRADFTVAQMSQRTTSSWDFTGSVGDKSGHRGDAAINMSNRAIAARQRLFQATDALGRQMAAIVLEICCMESGLESAERQLGWPRRSGKLVLQIALTKLAEHYGIVKQPQKLPPVAGVKHWGTQGYRPDIPPASP